MINGREIRAARERAGMTQGDLAQRVGVSLRTVGNWERGDTVPMNRASAVESALAQWLDRGDTEGPRLASASDGELLAEIARRFERGARDRQAPDEPGVVIPMKRDTGAPVEQTFEDRATVSDERAVAFEDDPALDEEIEAQQQEP